MQPIEFFLHAAGQHGHRLAAVDTATGQSLTYAQLRDGTWALAAALQRITGKQRPVVATLAGNSAGMLLGILATYACSGVLVPLTPMSVGQDIQRQLERARPDVVLHDACYESLLAGSACRRIVVDGKGEDDLAALVARHEGMAPSRACPDPGETIAIKFTGGSTGVPKAVLQSARCITTMVASLMLVYRFDAEERFLLAPPMTHGAGTFVLPVLGSGGCLVIANKARPEQLLALMQDHGITGTWVPPTLLHKLVELQEASRQPLPALRNLLYGGAPCPDALLVRAIEAFGPVMGVTYGLTEAPVIIAGMPGAIGSLPENRGSAGHTGPLVRVAVTGENGQPTDAPGTTGEIVARGDLLMSGYLDMPEQTAAVLKDGWFHTGDIGFIDERGFLFIRGRSKDMIISGGFNVYPSDVESIYARHPEVNECVVFGVADSYWGERVEMAIVRTPAAAVTQEALISFGKDQLGSVRTPKTIHFVDSFPKNSLGKVDKKQIIESLRDQIRHQET